MSMTETEVKQSRTKLESLTKCPKCKDKKKFLSREQYVEICKEC